MLSRRNIRIKVMQMLYAMSRDEHLTFKEALNTYRQMVEHAYELYFFILAYLIEVTRYSEQDARMKHSKLLPSDEDKAFTARLYDNPLVQSLVQNVNLQNKFKQYQLHRSLDEDTVRLLYTEFAKLDEYKQYLSLPQLTDEDHRAILLDLFKLCIGNEAFNDLVEDTYRQWDDDKSLVVGAIKKTLKALPAETYFYEEFRPPSETTVDFGETLFKKVVDSDQELLEIIGPTLMNWDAERVAIIDMVLLKMALCELMEFPTIPAKVTLNEFVEISKQYSTDKSKDFINGILDRLMKKLSDTGKINKQGRGLKE